MTVNRVLQVRVLRETTKGFGYDSVAALGSLGAKPGTF